MVYGKEVKLINVIRLAHLVGDLEEVIALAVSHRFPELDQLLGIRLHVGAVGQKFAQRRGTENISKEPVPAAVPDVEERTRARKPLGLANVHRFVGGYVDAVLHDGVGPGHAYDVELGEVTRKYPDGPAWRLHLLVKIPCL